MTTSTPPLWFLTALEQACSSSLSPNSIPTSEGTSFVSSISLKMKNGVSLFCKYGSGSAVSQLSAERIGLEALQSVQEVHTPSICLYEETEEGAVLALKKLPHSPWTPEAERALGKMLAILHRTQNTKFGFSSDNFIGGTEQRNTLTPKWGDFFVEHRLLFQLSEGKKNGWVSEEIEGLLHDVSEPIRRYLNTLNEPPSLLHGDLWSGNVICSHGTPYLIDPAVYYGNREAEIAFMHLFGGFGAGVFKAYHDHFPLDDGFQERISLYNLYHIMNHANLFGGSYIGSARTTLRELQRHFAI